MTLAVAAAPASARPFQVEDLLRQERLGEVILTPDERWLVFARRAGLATARRFDLGPHNRDLRSTLFVADLARGDPPRPLFGHEPGLGYRAGPLSPDGGRLAVWRVTAEGLELGVARIAAREVRWLGVTTEAPSLGRTVMWRGPRELVAIAMAPGETPSSLVAQRVQALLPQHWAAAARGEASVMAIGSGVYQGLRPPPRSKRLVSIEPDTGAVTTHAEGDFTDLEPSPSGRWLAILEAGPEIPLAPARPPQGRYGIAPREMRLRLLSFATGRLTTPCAGCDMLAGLLAWSRDDQLLVYARGQGQAWTEGRLAVVSPAAAALHELRSPVRPLVAGRPERVRAAWWGREPLVYGRAPGAARDDWHRLPAGPPANLTAALPATAGGQLVVTPQGPLFVVDGDAWRLTAEGRPQRVRSRPLRLPPLRTEDIPTRAEAAVRETEAAIGLLGEGAAVRVAWLSPTGVRPGPSVAAAEPVAFGASGVALLARSGGVERLVWRPGRGPDRVLAELNTHLAEVERPLARPVRHAGPRGEPRTSWLFLPRPAAGFPAPLVVIPYPGQSHASAPELWTGDPMSPAPILLGRGYAVLIPSLPSTGAEAGPAEGLGARILDILDAAARDPDLSSRFDAARPALWGHSFGAWGSLMAVSQTDRFAAVVATAGRTNLASAYGQFTPWRRLDPRDGLSIPWSAGWTESLQADMRAPPWEAPEKYRANSPVFQAGRMRTPAMIVAGELDGSHLGQAEEMFSGLYRQGKDAVLLSYWGEGHGFSSPGNVRDLYARALTFLDAHLRQAVTSSADGGRRPTHGSASSGPRTPGRRP